MDDDDLDGWVFDENFVQAGRHEPAARTREAIARLGDQQTSWRQPGQPAASQYPVPDQIPGLLAGGGIPQPRCPRLKARLMLIGILAVAFAGYGLWIYSSPKGSRIADDGKRPTAAGSTTPIGIAQSTPGQDRINDVLGINRGTPIGTCFRASSADPAQTGPIHLTTVGCASPHVYELVAIKEATDSATYPDQTYWQGPVSRACQHEFASYTGHADTHTQVAGRASTFFRPKPVSWADGDRTVFCVAHSSAALPGTIRTTP